MALVDNAWYVNFGDGSTTGYYALTKWAVATVTAAGTLRRQLAAPAVGSERVFVCVVAGTTHATTEPTWVITRGGKTTDNTVTWQECTGIAGLNGDATNTPSWTITATPPGGVKNTAVTLGQVIKRDSGASYQICTTAGTAGNGAEPAFSNTAGTTTADNTVTWTSLGVVGNFTAFGAPHARIANASTATWAQAGNSVFVGDNHAETQTTAITVGAIASLNIYCSDKTKSPPTSADLKTTATVTATGNSGITFSAPTNYFYGITFNAGSGAVNATLLMNAANNKFEACALRKLGTTGINSAIRTGTVVTSLVNTTMQFGATADSIQSGGRMTWENTASAITGATFPTTLFTPAVGALLVCRAVDFSGLASGAALNANFANNTGVFSFTDCKLPISAVFTTPSGATASVDVVRCDSAGTNYLHSRTAFEGSHVVETTIVRTGGASDGTTPISWKFVSTINPTWLRPFGSMQMALWCDTTGSHQVTIFGTTTGGGVPNNDDIWIEAEYLGSAGSPQGSIATTTKANNLVASATTNNSSDGSTWGGGGAGNGFKMVTPAFTVNQKGYITVTVKIAKVSVTYYVDPLIALS